MEQLSRQERLQLLRFVCSFVWADLQVTADERAFVHQMVRRLHLHPDEAQEVEGWLEVPPSPDDVDPAAIPEKHRQVFLDAVRAAAAADGQVGPAEREDLLLFERLLRPPSR
jgi:uncharacterized membrane protein YebE (DUF533 family)